MAGRIAGRDCPRLRARRGLVADVARLDYVDRDAVARFFQG